MPSRDALARCEQEIADANNLLRAGHPDVFGLSLCVADWTEEIRLIEAERRAADIQREPSR